MKSFALLLHFPKPSLVVPTSKACICSVVYINTGQKFNSLKKKKISQVGSSGWAPYNKKENNFKNDWELCSSGGNTYHAVGGNRQKLVQWCNWNNQCTRLGTLLSLLSDCYQRIDKICWKSSKNVDWFLLTYRVRIGMIEQITKQTRETYRGGGVIPSVIPRLLTNSKYSRPPKKTAAARNRVKTHPPANTIPPTVIPMPSPKITLFFNWLAFCWDSETQSSSADTLWPSSTS